MGFTSVNKFDRFIAFSTLDVFDNYAIKAKFLKERVNLFEEKGQNYIEIKDNGKGFDSSLSSNGNGLNNLKSRAEENNIGIKFNSTNGVEIKMWF